MAEGSISRREVLQMAAALGLAAAVGDGVADKKPMPMVGIQMGPSPLAKDDLDRLFDDLNSRAGVNAIFPFIYTYAPVTAGMPAAGFRGGNFAMPHMQYYKETPLTFQDMRAPDFGDIDALERA